MELDNTDWALLQALQTDASRSNLALAQDLHISAPTALRRVQRMQRMGLIERTVAILNPAQVAAHLGHGLTALVEVTLDQQGEEHQADFERAACAMPEVQQAYRVGPGPDWMLVMTVRDMPHYHRLAQTLLTERKNVRTLKAMFSIHRAKFGTALPLGQT